MSLFVGNLARAVSKDTLYDHFERFGECFVNFKGNYAFIEYNRERDADRAYDSM